MNMRKRIAEEEVAESLNTRKSFPRPPRVQLCFAINGLVHESDISRCVEAALSFWNEKSQLKQGPEYELVDALGCLQIRAPVIYHCNFTARPKNGSEAENDLFFAELMYKFPNPGQAILTCCFCCILGPSGTETGLCGCKICEKHPDIVQHPKQGGFRKKGGFSKKTKKVKFDGAL